MGGLYGDMLYLVCVPTGFTAMDPGFLGERESNIQYHSTVITLVISCFEIVCFCKVIKGLS